MRQSRGPGTDHRYPVYQAQGSGAIVSIGNHYLCGVPLRTIDKRELWHRLLVISGLSAAAVAAPLLDLYGNNPEVFVANRNTGGQIILFGILVALALPLLALAILTATHRIGPRSSGVAYLTLLVLTAAATGLIVSRQLVPENTFGAMALTAGITALLLFPHRWVEAGLRFFALLLPAALILYLAFSPTSRLTGCSRRSPLLRSATLGIRRRLCSSSSTNFPRLR